MHLTRINSKVTALLCFLEAPPPKRQVMSLIPGLNQVENHYISTSSIQRVNNDCRVKMLLALHKFANDVASILGVFEESYALFFRPAKIVIEHDEIVRLLAKKEGKSFIGVASEVYDATNGFLPEGFATVFVVIKEHDSHRMSPHEKRAPAEREPRLDFARVVCVTKANQAFISRRTRLSRPTNVEM